jgi:long-subunit fatty acid transport protein
VAYQFNDDFSLGASLDINYTELEFILPYFNSGVFAGTNGNQGDGVGLGGSFGALWTPGDWRFGMKYQMPVKVDINGHTDFTAALGLGRQDFDTVVHIPQQIQVGVAYQITDRWGVAFDAQYTDYERNNILELDYVAPLPNGQLPLHWEDIIGLHVGNSIQMTDKLTWEQGVGYLTYGAPDETMLPAIPDASGFVVNTGVKYDWNDHVSTYLSVAYAWGDRDIGYTPTRKAPGEMEASLFLLGAGLHYKF